MDKTTYLAYLESDYRRLREVAAPNLGAKVPTCPEWTMAELVRHVARVYLDKTETMRTGKEQSWQDLDLGTDGAVETLDRTYADLVAELTARDPAEPNETWFKPDQTVGFWVRRMPHETVIHRVDAELAAGAELAPIPTDLALDGIDEVLTCFLSFCSYEWHDYLGGVLDDADGRAVLVDAGSASWAVRLTTAGVDVSMTGETAAQVSGAPEDLLLWLWRRRPADAIDRDGDERLITKLWQVLGTTTV